MLNMNMLERFFSLKYEGQGGTFSGACCLGG